MSRGCKHGEGGIDLPYFDHYGQSFSSSVLICFWLYITVSDRDLQYMICACMCVFNISGNINRREKVPPHLLAGADPEFVDGGGGGGGGSKQRGFDRGFDLLILPVFFSLFFLISLKILHGNENEIILSVPPLDPPLL